MTIIISATIALLILSAFCLTDDSVALPRASSAVVVGWQPHTVRQLNGSAQQIRLSSKFQIISAKSRHRVATIPYLVYMPEKDRLLMLANYGYPHRPFTMTSDDHGDSWTAPRPLTVDKDGKPAGGLGLGLAYLGDGNALLYSGRDRWFSRDYGKTWGDTSRIAPPSDRSYWAPWLPPLVERDHKTGKVSRIAETGYAWFKPPEVKHDYQQGYIRFSTDKGKTWSEDIKVPQWKEVSEVALFRAGNGNLLAACRTDLPPGVTGNDHYEGLGISISKDDGRTWSTVEKLYNWGRHHPSLLLMPNGDIVMTYVVREGYVKDKNGFKQFGIEAIVSHDHGLTWDLDHKCILHAWVGNRTGEKDYWPAPYCASSSLLPDGSIITVFGTGYRSEPGPPEAPNQFAPRDLGLVQWRLNPEPVNADREIRDAPFDSDLGNIFDPSP